MNPVLVLLVLGFKNIAVSRNSVAFEFLRISEQADVGVFDATYFEKFLFYN